MDLERYIPEDCGQCGLKKSEIGEKHAKRHHQRYRIIAEMMSRYVPTDVRVLDIGSGEGYGAHYLHSVFHTVAGVEPDPTMRAHARHKYKRIKFFGLPKPRPVVFFVESLEHMTWDQIKQAIGIASAVGITCPIGETVDNPHHVQKFESVGVLIDKMREMDLHVVACQIEGPIELTTGGSATQFYGIFLRGENDDDA